MGTPPEGACPSGATVLISESFDDASAFPPSAWVSQVSDGGTVGFDGMEVFSPPGSMKANAIISNIGLNAQLLWVGASGPSTTHLAYAVKLTEVGGSGAQVEYGCTLTYVGPADHTVISLAHAANGPVAAAAATFLADGGSSSEKAALPGLPAGPLGWCKVSIDAVVSAGRVTAEITVTQAAPLSASGHVSVAAALGDTNGVHVACGVPYTSGAPETVTAYVDDVLLRRCP